MEGGWDDGHAEVDHEVDERSRGGAKVLRHVGVVPDLADGRGKGGRREGVPGVEDALGQAATDQQVAGEHPSRGGGRSDAGWQEQCGHDAGQGAQADLLLEADLDRKSLREDDREKASRNQKPAPRLGEAERPARRGGDCGGQHDTERRDPDDRCLQRPCEGREGGGHLPQLLGTSR